VVEIGNTLRDARRARGLTLEDVEEETKIRKKYIMAMEMDQFEVLPGPIYAKAFLKNYAKFLKINLDEIMDAFKQKQSGEIAHEEYEKPVAEKKVTTKRVPEKNVTAKRKPPYWLYAAAVLLIAAVVVSLFYGTRGLWSNSAAVNEGEQQNTDQIAAQDNTGQQQVPVQDNTANITGVKVVLNVISDRCWIQVIVDGTEAFQGELAAGETRSFEGKEKIFITLGNAGAVEVLENDKSIGFLGAAGDVINREFKAPTSQ
jgi:transcriptional regulator with XRE-family HTH domain